MVEGKDREDTVRKTMEVLGMGRCAVEEMYDIVHGLSDGDEVDTTDYEAIRQRAQHHEAAPARPLDPAAKAD